MKNKSFRLILLTVFILGLTLVGCEDPMGGSENGGSHGIGTGGGDDPGGGTGGGGGVNAPVIGRLFAGSPPISASASPIDLSGVTVSILGTPVATEDITVVDRAIAYVNANPGPYTLVLDGNVSVFGGFRSLNANNANLTVIGNGAERTISLNSATELL